MANALIKYYQYDGVKKEKLLFNNKNELFEFVEASECNINNLIQFIKGRYVMGGTDDGPEDWVSAFEMANRLEWRKDAIKLFVLLTDQGCHGNGFHMPLPKFGFIKDEIVIGVDNEEKPKLKNELHGFAEKRISLLLLGTNVKATIAFEHMKKVYSKILKYHNEENPEDYIDSQFEQLRVSNEKEFDDIKNEPFYKMFRKEFSNKISQTIDTMFMA